MKNKFGSLSLGLRFVILVVIVISIIRSLSAYYTIQNGIDRHETSFHEKADLLADDSGTAWTWRPAPGLPIARANSFAD